MKNQHSNYCSFKVNWAYMLSCLLVTGVIFGYLTWKITYPMLNESLRLEHIKNGFNWPFIIILDLFCWICFVWLLIKAKFDWQTEYNENEIRQPSLFKVRVIKWQEVTQVKWVQFGLHIYSLTERIVITPYAYKNPNNVIEELEKKIKIKYYSIQSKRDEFKNQFQMGLKKRESQ